MTSESNKKTPKVLLTVLLGVLLPGFGQIYLGQISKGILIFLLVSFGTVIQILLSSVLAVLLYVYFVYDAYRRARELNGLPKLTVIKLSGFIAGIFLLVIIWRFISLKGVESVAFQFFNIPSGGMRPTMIEGDRLISNNLFYGLHIPYSRKYLFRYSAVKRGDLVIFIAPSEAIEPYEREANVKKSFSKRCVGIPGDKIEIRNKKLYLNDVLQEEPYATYTDTFNDNRPKLDNFGPAIVPPEHYFMLGDNRDCSRDSRFWGPLPEEYVIGKAWLIYYPINRWGLLH